jgi:hypothetical protein
MRLFARVCPSFSAGVCLLAIDARLLCLLFPYIENLTNPGQLASRYSSGGMYVPRFTSLSLTATFSMHIRPAQDHSRLASWFREGNRW